MQFLTPARCTLEYELPLAEVVTDFFDELKSRSKGYASMEYTPLDYRTESLVLLEVKINGEAADPLSTICHRCAHHGNASLGPCSACRPVWTCALVACFLVLHEAPACASWPCALSICAARFTHQTCVQR
jgi:Elongation factor G C-terminus